MYAGREGTGVSYALKQSSMDWASSWAAVVRPQNRVTRRRTKTNSSPSWCGPGPWDVRPSSEGGGREASDLLQTPHALLGQIEIFAHAYRTHKMPPDLQRYRGLYACGGGEIQGRFSGCERRLLPVLAFSRKCAVSMKFGGNWVSKH